MCVAGSFTGWDLPKMSMPYLGKNKWKSAYIYLSQGSYEYKIANSGNWSKDDWGNAEGLKGTLKLTTGTSKNAKLNITEAGNYGFSFN